MDIKPISQLPTETKPTDTGDRPRKLWIGTYVTIALISLAAWLLLRLKVFEIFGTWLVLLKKLSLGVLFASLVMIVTKTAEGIVLKRSATFYEVKIMPTQELCPKFCRNLLNLT